MNRYSDLNTDFNSPTTLLLLEKLIFLLSEDEIKSINNILLGAWTRIQKDNREDENK